MGLLFSSLSNPAKFKPTASAAHLLALPTGDADTGHDRLAEAFLREPRRPAAPAPLVHLRPQEIAELEVTRPAFPNFAGFRRFAFRRGNSPSLQRSPSPRRRYPPHLHHDIGFSDTVSNVVEIVKHEHQKERSQRRYPRGRLAGGAPRNGPLHSVCFQGRGRRRRARRGRRRPLWALASTTTRGRPVRRTEITVLPVYVNVLVHPVPHTQFLISMVLP